MTLHANRGVGWERMLEGWHDTYRRDQRAVVFRTPPPVKVLSRVTGGGEFRACFRSDGPPDYAGVVAGGGPKGPFGMAMGGRPVAFDAKDCEGPRWPFSALERHQARDLEGWQVAGGTAFVALRLGEVGWVLPWTRLGPLWWAWHDDLGDRRGVGRTTGKATKGTASLDAQECARIGARMPMPGNWLEPLCLI